MKTRHILFLLLAVLTAATSCVYDYNPQIEGEGGYLIVEGNIVIGDMCNVRLDYSWSLVDTTQGDERWRILSSSKMYIEDSSGGRYENRYGNGGYEPYMDSYYYGRGSYGLFDLQDADPSLEYRLVIENEKGTYASVWQKSLDAGEIDDLSYKISDDGPGVRPLRRSRRKLLSLECQGNLGIPRRRICHLHVPGVFPRGRRSGLS